MLQFNFQPVFAARGIAKPYTYLRQNGFSQNLAHRISHSAVDNMKLKNLERLCIMLRCSVSDVLVWTPDHPAHDIATHPLYDYKKKDAQFVMQNDLSNLTMQQLKELNEHIARMRSDK